MRKLINKIRRAILRHDINAWLKVYPQACPDAQRAILREIAICKLRLAQLEG